MQNLKGHVKINNTEAFISQLHYKIGSCQDDISTIENEFSSWSKDTYTKRLFFKDRTAEECKSSALSDKYAEEVWNYYEDISYIKNKKRELDKLLTIAVNCLMKNNELNVSFEDYYTVIEE